MKACRALSVLSLVLLPSATVLAQDAVKADPAHYKVVLENSSVRVLRISYPVGSKSTMHHHPDTIVIPLADSKVRFTMADGTSQDADLPAGSATYSPEVSHNPANIGTAPIDGLLVEFKAAAPGTATLPTSRPNMTVKTLAEGPRGAAYSTTADPTFHEPAGSTHEYDQVVIALGDAQMSLSIDGKPAKTTWKRGDVQFIGRGVAHESQNTGGKPVDFVIVAIK
jgi:quercetin dioxygenase-like cupin family protein